MNAKQEFLKHTENKTVKCAKIGIDENWNGPSNWHILPLNYTDEQKEEFLKRIDFIYDEGYGSQELFGTIWYNDGTWSGREEYDGSEWWNYFKCPEIQL